MCRNNSRSRSSALGFSFRRMQLPKSGIAVNSGHAYRTNNMDVLTRIKRLVVARQVEFTGKAEQERLADGLSVEDVLESILNANAIKKVLRSQSPVRHSSRDYLYVIESPSYTGLWIYSKGSIRRKGGREIYYVFISSKLTT